MRHGESIQRILQEIFQIMIQFNFVSLPLSKNESKEQNMQIKAE